MLTGAEESQPSFCFRNNSGAAWEIGMQQFGVRGPLHDTQLVDSDSETVLQAEVMEPGDKLLQRSRGSRMAPYSHFQQPVERGRVEGGRLMAYHMRLAGDKEAQ